MSYDPFRRGPFAVGVRSAGLVDAERDRPLPIEVWYPADDAHAGADLADDTKDRYELYPGLPALTQDAVRDATPRRDRFPLVGFSHGFGAHRRQSTFLCTHLASHGYVVAAVDHTGNTTLDILELRRTVRKGDGSQPKGLLATFMDARPRDVGFLLDRVLDGTAGDVAALVDSDRIAMSGHSFGGWTTLAAVGRDRRIRAALPLAPAGGANAFRTNPFRDALDLDWDREVPTFFLVAERDTMLPLAGMRELFDRTPSAGKRMVVLENADHMHFCDNAEQVHEMFRLLPPPGGFEAVAKATPPMADLCPPEHAYDVARGLGLAHLDAALKANDDAARLLAGDLRGLMSARGVRVAVHCTAAT